ncbi:hypothetical protein K435DRAFT_937775 [Dendrothele bispora CBS 962.96]|uniref:Transmembrane protein n=1 Tax=Dendrothele bispora (strain CBS 962.96) TaxID=1314807 RepID=A0A4S8KZ27_DENBC|nr:hypothetical protein K435DRAFT_937775 [Dendrothele bispora CBS 962.96]
MYTSTEINEALLPEATVREIQVTIYVLFASLGILIWDILWHLVDDYRMVSKGPFGTPIIVYLLWLTSTFRFSCVGMLVTGLFMGPARIDINCHIAAVFLETFFVLVVGSTLGLLYLRARAICLDHPLVRSLLLILWLATVGSSSVAFFVVNAIPSPDKELFTCIIILDHFSAGVAVAITAIVHDTAVFVAISWKMYKLIYPSRSGNHEAVTFFIPSPTASASLWKCILQDGQIFYLISLFWEVLVTILALMSSIDPYYRFFMLSIHLIIVNSMACHVFRNVRLGRFREEVFSSNNMVATRGGLTAPTVHFAPNVLHPVAGSSAQPTLSGPILPH